METKVCKLCLIEKEYKEFSLDRGRLISYCKKCNSKKAYKWRKNNVERWNINQEKYLNKLRPNRKPRIYRLTNRPKISKREFYLQNKEKILQVNRNWYSKNKTKAHQSTGRWIKQKRINDVSYRMSNNLGNRLRSILKDRKTNKKNKTLEYIGCSKEELKQHLEKQFINGMSWDNYGKWEIDHIYPISRFDFTIEENIYKAMNYTNLQPLWKIDNIRKGNKILEKM